MGRLDSDGIQKVRQTLPASRNPFSYYRHHHLDTQRWDVVVIDE